MATWIAHLRVAEALLEHLQVKDLEAFLAGSIGPDSGRKTKGIDSFDPPSKITHFIKDTYKDSIDTEGFYERYLKDKPNDDFYLAYYIHLLCDVSWSKNISKPVISEYYSEFEHNPHFMSVIKQDWYGLDFEFLEDHPDWWIFKRFSSIKHFDNHYFDFYTKDAFTIQIGEISRYYVNPKNRPEYLGIFLKKSEMEEWIDETLVMIKDDLQEKGWSRA